MLSADQEWEHFLEGNTLFDLDESENKKNFIPKVSDLYISTQTKIVYLNHVINLNDVLTMSESNDIEMILMHQEYVRKVDDDPASGSSNHKLDKKMGYLANVNDAREILEKLYNSPSNKDISN